MRIIAGTAKGVRLGRVPRGTRPLSDRAREGLFSSLGGDVVDASVLDLYAGTGAIGIEALSRGGAHATFVDEGRRAVLTLGGNLERTRLQDKATVVRKSVLSYLSGPVRSAQLVFLDPPYDTAEGELSQVITCLGGWLDPESWTVALTRPSKGYMPVIPVDWRLAKRLVYGDTLIALFREV